VRQRRLSPMLPRSLRPTVSDDGPLMGSADMKVRDRVVRPGGVWVDQAVLYCIKATERETCRSSLRLPISTPS
jgi:hypothetical protein